jgi:hypothetical protein
MTSFDTEGFRGVGDVTVVAFEFGEDGGSLEAGNAIG